MSKNVSLLRDPAAVVNPSLWADLNAAETACIANDWRARELWPEFDKAKNAVLDVAHAELLRGNAQTRARACRYPADTRWPLVLAVYRARRDDAAFAYDWLLSADASERERITAEYRKAAAEVDFDFISQLEAVPHVQKH